VTQPGQGISGTYVLYRVIASIPLCGSIVGSKVHGGMAAYRGWSPMCCGIGVLTPPCMHLT
jgi:hypothetical protein